MKPMRLIGRIRQFMSVRVDSPELLRAQFAALSRMIPLLYFILVANACVLTVTFYGKAPNWLNLYVALALSAVCAVRLLQWWRRREIVFTDEQAAHELRRTNWLAGILGVVFSTWLIALFPYGGTYAKAHVGTFMAVAMLSSMLCLIHLRSAALIVAVTVCIPGTIFFVITGIPAFYGAAINILLVAGAAVIVILIQYRDFTRMIEELKQTELLGNENLRLANLDSLTNLPNRRAFFTHLDAAFARAQAQGTRLALGVIDLDGFKPVNDVYGHSTGDRLLVAMADRFLRARRAKVFPTKKALVQSRLISASQPIQPSRRSAINLPESGPSRLLLRTSFRRLQLA